MKILMFPILVLAALVFSCASETTKTSRVDTTALSWPIFRGDAQLTGQADGALSEALELLWSFQTGDDIKSSPIVGHSKVYIGSTDGLLYALDAATGDSLWAFDAGDDIEAPALLLDSTVYIGSLSGDFFALNAHNGNLLWTFTAEDEIYGSAVWMKAPNGQDIWLIVGSYDFRVYAIDASTGEQQWSYETDNYINGAPATNGQFAVFGGCDERLHIVSVADGSKIGEVIAGSYIAGSAALYEGTAYLGHYGETLMAIDAEAQEIIWEYDNNGETRAFFSTPAVDENHVVIGSRDKLVHCVNRNTGEQLWTFQTRDDVDSSPVICDDKVVVGSNDGRLYVLNLNEGSLIWSYEIGSPVVGSPAVTGGYIFIGAEDGRVYAFGGEL